MVQPTCQAGGTICLGKHECKLPTKLPFLVINKTLFKWESKVGKCKTGLRACVCVCVCFP